MNKIILNLFNIRKGEGLKAFLMFLYIFLIISSLLIVKPVRNSLFIVKFGVSQLPYVFMLVAISAAIVTKIYSRFALKIRLNILILNTLIICIFCLLLFWVLLYFKYQSGWFLYVFYVWVAIFGVVTTSQFWLLANYVFNSREAKRLFGFIGAGAISGGIFGGYLTNFLADLIGSGNMVFFCIAFLGGCILILKKVWKVGARQNYRESFTQQKRIQQKDAAQSPLKLILNSRHLTYIAGIIGVSVIVANLVDYQYSAIASKLITNEDQLTAFFGFWLSNLSIVSLSIQFFLTGKILKYLGVTASLFFLPVGILIGALAIFINPALWSAVLIKVSDGGFKQSINKAGLELLYLPVPSAEKNQAKAFIDVFIDSLATGLGGILLIIFANNLGFSVQQISLIVLLLIGIWLYLLYQVRYQYINAFRSALEKRSIDLSEQNINIEDASIFESLIQVLKGQNEKKILYALQLIEDTHNPIFIPYLKELLQSGSSAIKLLAIRILRNYDELEMVPEIEDLIYAADFEVKIEAMRYIFKYSPNSQYYLMELLANKDYMVRSAALICVGLEYRENRDRLQYVDIVKLVYDFIDKIISQDSDRIEKDFLKINLARVIGICQEPALYKFLLNFLKDESIEVVKAGVINAGYTRDRMFLPFLINLLNQKQVRTVVQEALGEYGSEAIDKLSESINDPDLDIRIKIGIYRALSFIGIQETVKLLIEKLSIRNHHVQFVVLKSLNKLKSRFPLLKFDEKRIHEKILDEIDHYHRNISALCAVKENLKAKKDDTKLEPANDRPERVKLLLIKALEESLADILERIFRLLGLLYSSEDMYNTYLGIVSERKNLRANAIELLDNLLDQELKKILIPLVEIPSLDVLISEGLPLSQIVKMTEKESLRYLLESGDNWLKICSLYLIGQLRYREEHTLIRTFTEDQDPNIRETAQMVLHQIS